MDRLIRYVDRMCSLGVLRRFADSELTGLIQHRVKLDYLAPALFDVVLFHCSLAAPACQPALEDLRCVDMRLAILVADCDHLQLPRGEVEVLGVVGQKVVDRGC